MNIKNLNKKKASANMQTPSNSQLECSMFVGPLSKEDL